MVTYKEILPNEVSIIKELWIKNRDYHAAMEPHFKSQYLNLSFEARMQSLFASKQKQYKITLAAQNDTVVGYCISEYENGRVKLCRSMFSKPYEDKESGSSC